ncbi:ferrous iron transport protein B [Bdellovibrionota bacterium]
MDSESVHTNELGTKSQVLDSILTHRVWGLPIFLGVMWSVFHLSFSLSEAPMTWMEFGFEKLGVFVSSIVPAGVLRSLLVDGIIGGVGGVLSFVPIIMLLFLGISILENCGYMARAAFVADRFMSKIGLPGKAFVPLLLGFGCGVPAVIATRTLSCKRDRLTTMLMIPLMSCGARLPVYALFIAAFFKPAVGSYVLFSLYLLGIIIAILTAKVFQQFVFRGSFIPSSVELPSYKMPTVKSVLIPMWERAWMFIRKAGTVLLAGSVIIWALCNFPANVSYSRDFVLEKEQIAASAVVAKEQKIQQINREMEKERIQGSFAGKMGVFLEDLLRPIGLGDWRLGVALFSGFAAKEVVVSTLGVLFSLDGKSSGGATSLRSTLRADPFFTPLSVLSFLIFVLLYLPCLALLGVIGRETKSIGWPVFTAVYLTGLAWVVSFVVYQGGRLLGLGA